MIRFTFGAHEVDAVHTADFSQVVEAIKGRAIVSLGEWEGESRFELGLSGSVMLRVLTSGTDIEINCVSTQNPNEPLASALFNGTCLEPSQFGNLRQNCAVSEPRSQSFICLRLPGKRNWRRYLRHHPFGDIDRALLATEDRLHIESVSYGSWVAVVCTKARTALRAHCSRHNLCSAHS